MSVSLSMPAPNLNFFAFSTISGIQDLVGPTKTTVGNAMHLYPVAPKAAETKAFKVSSLSASGKTIA